MNPWFSVVAPLLIAYAGTLVWVWQRWTMAGSFYSHGPLVPVLAVVVLWTQRERWLRTEAVPDPRAWVLLAPALLLHVVGSALLIDSLSAASMVLALPAAVWLVAGPRRLAALAPVVALVVFAVPLPLVMTGRAAFELKELAIDGVVALCDAIGLDVTRGAGALFVAPHQEGLVVANECSGLRSLMALTTLGYCVAFFMGSQRGPRRWVLLLASVPIAVFTNVIRITLICVLAWAFGVEFAATTGHTVTGWLAWGLAFGMLFGLDLVVSRIGGER